MRYIYHMRSTHMRGHTLYPLNTLKGIAPDIYERARAKYLDHPTRTKLPLRVIPKLGCLWNDVAHFAPLHPHLVYRVWRELGNTLPSVRWIQVPVERIAQLPAVTYRPAPKRLAGHALLDDEVEWFDARAYRELDALPKATLEWYAELNQRGLTGAWFSGVPHVLIKGEIDVSNLSVVDWCQPSA